MEIFFGELQVELDAGYPTFSALILNKFRSHSATATVKLEMDSEMRDIFELSQFSCYREQNFIPY
jgi:hypothetical protein